MKFLSVKKILKGGVVLGVALAALSSAQAEEGDAVISFKILTPEAAIRVAVATMESCREQGYQVGVTVVDRSGVVQAVVRDRFAGPHTLETSRRKAWTSISFRETTLTLAEKTQAGSSNSGIRFVDNAMMAGGGVPIESAGSLVGGVGVSGAPTGAADQACAEAGIDSIVDDMEF